jgi:hypothetical protein
MQRKTRKLVKANITHIDPLNCNTTIGYTIIEGRRGLYADMDLSDCGRKIPWGFAKRDGNGVLAKIDKAIAIMQEFRTEWLRVARRQARPRKRRA